MALSSRSVTVALVVALVLPLGSLAFAESSPTGTHLEHLAHVEGAEAGAGLVVREGFAYVAGLHAGFYVVDVRNPEEPVKMGSLPNLWSRDIQVVEYPDGTFLVLLAAEESGVHVVDAQDPAQPTRLHTFHVRPEENSHNIAVLPGTRLLYNANSRGVERDNAVVDLTEPLQPRLVVEYGSRGCHDVKFHQGPGKARLYCAAVGATEIWDLADPLQPLFISEVRNPFLSAAGAAHVGEAYQLIRDGVGLSTLGFESLLEVGPGLHHWAQANQDGTLLIIGDEFAGAAGPGCTVSANVAGRTVSVPVGAVWFYDVADEGHPQLLSWFSAPFPPSYVDDTLRFVKGIQVLPEAETNHAEVPQLNEPISEEPFYWPRCTVHFGSLVGDRPLLVAGWYTAGVVLIDFSDPRNPVMADWWNEGTDTWDATYSDGYVVTGDTHRGSDTFAIVDPLDS